MSLIPPGPREPDTHNLLGGEARELLERSIVLDFAPRQTYYYLGSVLVQLEKKEEALAAFEKCFTRFVDENVFAIYIELALQMKETEKARQAAEFLLSTNPPSPIWQQTRYQMANVATQLGDYNGAIRLLEELIDDAPSYEPAYVGLANLYGGLGFDSLAIDTYERALTLIDRRITQATRWIDRLEGVGSAQEISSATQSRQALLRSKAFVLEQLETLSP